VNVVDILAMASRTSAAVVVAKCHNTCWPVVQCCDYCSSNAV